MFTIENLKYPEKAKSRKYNLQSYLPVIITINILLSSTYLSPIVGHLGYFSSLLNNPLLYILLKNSYYHFARICIVTSGQMLFQEMSLLSQRVCLILRLFVQVDLQKNPICIFSFQQYVRLLVPSNTF